MHYDINIYFNRSNNGFMHRFNQASGGLKILEHAKHARVRLKTFLDCNHIYREHKKFLVYTLE